MTSDCTAELRPAAELGISAFGGLSGRHHFSFAAYQRPDRLDWGSLRAVHHYRLEAGAIRTPTFHAGFEIVTLVETGQLRRLGTFAPRQLLMPGAAELVSPGRGVDLGVEAIGPEPAGWTEVWVRSEGMPRRARRHVLPAASRGANRTIAGLSPGLPWQSRGRLEQIALAAGGLRAFDLGEGVRGYVVVQSGAIKAGDEYGEAGDAWAVAGPGRFRVVAQAPAILLWLLLP